jgi:dTMP kinase
MYVAIEGIDTAGKSTQIERLSRAFSDAVITKEPGGTAIGQTIRDILLHQGVKSAKAEFLLFLADRAEHMEEIIKPRREGLIISDRSVVSGAAYAMVQNTIDNNEILMLNRFATDAIFPDIVFLLELSEQELSHRLSKKELDGIESRGTEYLLNIQNALKDASNLLGITLVSIDASRSIEAITETITNTIKEHV